MLSHTHNVQDDGGGLTKISQCSCGRCDNIWWVRALPEFQPAYCPYCGLKFVGYDNDAGGKFDLSGKPRA